METILLAIVVVGLAVIGLSVGVLFGREPIKGSCGGLNCIKHADCAACANRGKAKP